MKTRVVGDKLVNDDFVFPEVVIAEFHPDLKKRTKKEISLVLNKGFEMLACYEKRRNNLHINNVVSMLKEME